MPFSSCSLRNWTFSYPCSSLLKRRSLTTVHVSKVKRSFLGQHCHQVWAYIQESTVYNHASACIDPGPFLQNRALMEDSSALNKLIQHGKWSMLIKSSFRSEWMEKSVTVKVTAELNIYMSLITRKLNIKRYFSSKSDFLLFCFIIVYYMLVRTHLTKLHHVKKVWNTIIVKVYFYLKMQRRKNS